MLIQDLLDKKKEVMLGIKNAQLQNNPKQK
jgi:hypothetical protein